MKRVLLSLLSLILIAQSSALAFKDGEKLVFSVKYGLVSPAEATITANSSTYQGIPVWYLKIEAHTHSFFDTVFKIRDKVESWWRKDNLLPLKFSKVLQEGSYRQNRIHLFNHQAKTTEYSKYSFKNGTYKTETLPIPANTQDVLSSFFHVRNQNLVPGKKVIINITTDGRSVNTETVVHRRESIHTIFGYTPCLVIEPKLKQEGVFKQSGKITIWVTDDAYKIPVRLESAVSFGSFVATLKSAQNVPYKIK